jgi:hypothetical protein
MVSDTSLENAMLLADNKRLQARLKAMQETINTMVERNTVLLAEKAISGCASPDSKLEDRSKPCKLKLITVAFRFRR